MEGNLIFKQIPAIMREIEPIAKARKNSQQGYQYRGVDDVMNELAPILAKHGVFPVTEIKDTSFTEQITSKTGTAGYHVIRSYYFRLYAEDGSYIQACIEGEASDYGDKSIGKAHSYAYRDFLMKTFCIPTEGDNDTDKHSPEFTTNKQAETKQEEPKHTDGTKPEVKWVTEKQFLAIKDALMSGDPEKIEKAKLNFKALTTAPYAMKKDYRTELETIIKNLQ